MHLSLQPEQALLLKVWDNVCTPIYVQHLAQNIRLIDKKKLNSGIPSSEGLVCRNQVYQPSWLIIKHSDMNRSSLGPNFDGLSQFSCDHRQYVQVYCTCIISYVSD